MALTPEEIERRHFDVVDHGYDREEVDRFLADVAASYRYAIHNLLPGVAAPEPDTDGSSEVPAAGPAVSPTAESFGRLGDHVAEILRSAEDLATRLLGEAETDADSARARADLEAAETRQAGERDRDQAKRALAKAKEQAEAIVAEAEQRAEALRRDVEDDAQTRARQLLDRAQRRVETVLAAERAAIERLRAVRAELEITIDRLTSPDQRRVVDLTEGAPVVQVGRHPAAGKAVPAPDDAPDDRVSGHASAGATTASGTETTSDDSVARMVRAAVGRAVQVSTSGPRTAGDTGDTGATEQAGPVGPDAEPDFDPPACPSAGPPDPRNGGHPPGAPRAGRRKP